MILVLVAFALSSCGTEQGGPTGEDAEPPPREVTREVTKTVTVAEAPEDKEDPAPSSASPRDEQDATQEGSPEEVLALQYRLINAGDYEGAYALFADESKQLITPEQYRAYFEANAPYSITDYSFLSVDDRGDEATVEAALTATSGSGQESYQVTQPLVRQGATWRVVMRDEQASAFATAEQETAQYESEPTPTPEAAPTPADEEVGEVFVRVTGDAGISFQGNIATLDGSRSVEGTTPQEFAVEVDTGFLSGDSVSATAQNSDGAGNLTVQIVSDGKVVKEATTTAQYGVASVSWIPSE
ncbi:MAG: hypothetical protein M3R38_12985 [Actinomycetota bacterium]|nr:hypothetical protein [Actinomycetota bacterium]